MSDLLKEFKMTDLLGMMMPGTLVVLLFGLESGLWESVSARTAFPKGDVFLTVTSLVAGYAVGMLIHELADWLERWLWQDPVVDPRTQAVAASGYVCLKGRRVKLRETAADQTTDHKGEMLRTGVCFVLLGSAAGLALGKQWGVLVGAAAGALGYGLLRWRMNERLNGLCRRIGGDPEQARALILLARRNNQLLSYHRQARLYGSEEYERMVLRKHDLFDGFRTMARNTFLTVLLLGDYGAVSRRELAELCDKVRSYPAGLGLVVAVMVLLAVRFYHYTYLRYKYIYEDAACESVR